MLARRIMQKKKAAQNCCSTSKKLDYPRALGREDPTTLFASTSEETSSITDASRRVSSSDPSDSNANANESKSTATTVCPFTHALSKASTQRSLKRSFDVLNTIDFTTPRREYDGHWFFGGGVHCDEVFSQEDANELLTFVDKYIKVKGEGKSSCGDESTNDAASASNDSSGKKRRV